MSTYKAFTETEAKEYAKKLNLFNEKANLVSKEIGDGNLNLVFRIVDEQNNKSVIFKQALPYARCVGESWPLTLDRARIESEALIIQGQLCPDLVPKVYHYDKILAVTVMEDLSDHVIMRKGLIQKNKYPLFPEHIGRFMATTLFMTSDLAMDAMEKKKRVGQFLNPELCKITEDLVFTDPYYDAPKNNFSEAIRTTVEKIWNNDKLKREVAKLKQDFLTKTQALIHGDLHTGSVFVTKDSTKVIDPEFAYYGPMGFDIGAVIANLILNIAAQEGHSNTNEEIQQYREYLLKTIEDLWISFEKNFISLWDNNLADISAKVEGYREYYIQSILKDSCGYGGCKTIRRIIGLAHVADIDTIEDIDKKTRAENIALELGQQLILNRENITSIYELTGLVRKAL
jgi:5-methylthioribose kinase